MQSNRLTIVPVDSAVYRDQAVYIGLDLSDCNIPENVHALQWMNGSGWIEFTNTDPNEEITILPQWAENCINKWEVAHEETLLYNQMMQSEQVPPTE